MRARAAHGTGLAEVPSEARRNDPGAAMRRCRDISALTGPGIAPAERSIRWEKRLMGTVKTDVFSRTETPLSEAEERARALEQVLAQIG